MNQQKFGALIRTGESFSRGAVQGIFKLYRSLIVFSREI